MRQDQKPESNGILRLYHQFPYFYHTIDEMTEQLPHICHNLVCNAVWVGPLQDPGRSQVMRNNRTVSGGMYAMRDHINFNPTLNITPEKLLTYTQKCQELNISPIFDLVLNQVDHDIHAPIVKDLGVENFTFRGKPWDDAFFFNYNNPDFAERVIDKLWKPFITKYIVDYGFRGVRLDAVKKMATFPDVLRQICTHIDITCQAAHGCPPIILAELLDKNPLQFVDSLRGFGFSHILNSTYSSLYSKRARQGDGTFRGQWNGGQTRNWLLHEIGTLQSIFYDASVAQTGIGGTIGYVGNHDKAALGNTVETLISAGDSTSKDTLEAAREFIFGVSCVSDAGWYLLSGDEYVLKSKSEGRNITFSSDTKPLKWGEMTNDTHLCGFIGALNYVLSQLTATAYPYWVELSTVENNEHNIAIALRHVGAGARQQHELICVRLSNADCPLLILMQGVTQYLERYRAQRAHDANLIISAIYIVNDTIVTTLDTDYTVRGEWRWENRVGNDTPLFGQQEILRLRQHP